VCCVIPPTSGSLPYDGSIFEAPPSGRSRPGTPSTAAAKLAAVLDGDHDNGAVGGALDLLRRFSALAEARRTARAEVADQVLDRQV
jgi:hypothetical protein